MKNLENNIEHLLNTQPVYNESATDGETGFVKKMGRKKNDGMLNEFGNRQNQLNAELIQTLNGLAEYCRSLEEQLEIGRASCRERV